MKQTVEVPWSVGDTGWAILSRTVKNDHSCETCGHRTSENKYVEEVLECQIDAIEVRLTSGVTTYWYRVAFDVSEGHKYPKHGRFTYGTHVQNVFSSKEEAEIALAKERE